MLHGRTSIMTNLSLKVFKLHIVLEHFLAQFYCNIFYGASPLGHKGIAWITVASPLVTSASHLGYSSIVLVSLEHRPRVAGASPDLSPIAHRPRVFAQARGGGLMQPCPKRK